MAMISLLQFDLALKVDLDAMQFPLYLVSFFNIFLNQDIPHIQQQQGRQRWQLGRQQVRQQRHDQ